MSQLRGSEAEGLSNKAITILLGPLVSLWSSCDVITVKIYFLLKIRISNVSKNYHRSTKWSGWPSHCEKRLLPNQRAKPLISDQTFRLRLHA